MFDEGGGVVDLTRDPWVFEDAGRPVPVPDTERWLLERIADRNLFSGAQVAVLHHGRSVVDLAVGTDGLGRPVRPSTQFRAYCASKPFLAAAVCRAAERGTLDRAAPLGRYLPGLDQALARVRITDLLHHQTNFTQPTGFGSVFIPAGTRVDAVQRMCETALRQPRPNGYGEVANWLLLAEALAASTGRRWTALVAEHGADSRLPMGELSLDAAALARSHRSGHVGVNVCLRNGRLLPLLGEVGSSLGGRLDGPGFGAACSVRFLARFLRDSVVTRRYGDPMRAVAVRADATYGRDLLFSDGLMVGPDTLGISDLWPDDVAGHNGIGGMTVAFASRSHDLAVGIHLNGLMGPEDGGGHVRPFLTSLLHSELADVLARR
jgi:CubicO group peptidase (beta-lactamase class C family)